jgi:choline dehydrogenase-like flavoprotein
MSESINALELRPWRWMIDGMVYVRGSKADYDRYAAFGGDPGWASVYPKPLDEICLMLHTQMGRHSTLHTEGTTISW